MAEPSSNPILNAASSLQNNTASRLQDLEAAMQEATAAQVARVQEIKAGQLKVEQATGILNESVRAATDANIIIQTAKDVADLEAQNATIAGFEKAGGNELQAMLLETLQADIKRTQDLQKQYLDIADNQPTGIQFVDTIINSFSGMQTQMELAAAEDKQQTTLRNLQSMTAATESVNQTNLLTKKTLNEEVISQRMKALRAEASFKIAQQDIANVETNARGMDMLARADAQMLDMRAQLYKQAENQEDRAFQREVMDQRRTEFNQQLEEWKIRKPSMELSLDQQRLAYEDATDPATRTARRIQLEREEKEYSDILRFEIDAVEAVQRAESSMSKALTEPSIIIRNLQSSGPTRMQYEKLMEIGADPDAALGADAYEAAQNILIIDPTSSSKSTKYKKVLEDTSRALEAEYAKDPTKIPKTEEGRKQQFNAAAEAGMATYAKEIKSGDASNPYAAPPMDTLASIKAVADSPLYKKILAPKGYKEVDAQNIVDSAIQGVLAKQITPEQAARDVTTLFKAAVDYNNTIQGGFKRVGLSAQTSYNVSLKRPPSAFEKDLSNLRFLPTIFIAGLAAPVAPELSNRMYSGVEARKYNMGYLYETVDLTDPVKVQNTIVKFLNTAKPQNPSSAPATTQTSK